MFLDHIFMTFIAMLFAIPQFAGMFAGAFNTGHEPTSKPGISGLIYISLFGFSLYFNKDAFSGRSLAKRILKLQVVNHKTGEAAGPLRCFVRNLFCIIWPVEFFVAIANPERRLGDRVAGTRTVTFVPSVVKQPTNFRQLLLAIPLSYLVLVLLSFPVLKINGRMGARTEFVDYKSCNTKLSEETTRLFNDSLGNYLQADIKVYEKTQKPGIRFVSAIFKLRNNYLEDEDDFNTLRSMTDALLNKRFQTKTFTAEIKYIYNAFGSMHMRYTSIDL